jgi:rhodanese-related sulfurtransferase
MASTANRPTRTARWTQWRHTPDWMRTSLLDVREQTEWDAGHIEQAVHIPMGELNARVDEIPSDRPIVVVCRSGNRSQAVTDALNRAGWTAHNLEGGMYAWQSAGLDFVATDGGDPRVASRPPRRLT